MSKRVFIGWTLLLGLTLSPRSAFSQNEPTRELYQIVSGRSVACCGIAGAMIEPLPDNGNAFIELQVDRQRNVAEMRILGQDMATVKRIPAESCRDEFIYTFTNGVVFPDHIQFGDPLVPPNPEKQGFSFVVSNVLDSVTLNGTVVAPCPGIADLPVTFEHTNVLAVLMPMAGIRVSEVEVCWTSSSNRIYQVQYRSALTTNEWTSLGSPIAGNGSTLCVPDEVPSGEPRRFYRVFIVP